MHCPQLVWVAYIPARYGAADRLTDFIHAFQSDGIHPATLLTLVRPPILEVRITITEKVS